MASTSRPTLLPDALSVFTRTLPPVEMTTVEELSYYDGPIEVIATDGHLFYHGMVWDIDDVTRSYYRWCFYPLLESSRPMLEGKISLREHILQCPYVLVLDFDYRVSGPSGSPIAAWKVAPTDLVEQYLPDQSCMWDYRSDVAEIDKYLGK